jgi:hypothetical protein
MADPCAGCNQTQVGALTVGSRAELSGFPNTAALIGLLGQVATGAFTGTLAGEGLVETFVSGSPALALAGDTVPNIAALIALPTANLSDGHTTGVVTVKDIFRLDKTSTLALTSATVLATDTGVGRWVRLGIPNLAWQTQATWFVNPGGGGNDENTGLTVGVPLATVGEWMRRVGSSGNPGVSANGFIGQDTTITLLDNIPASDPFRVTVTLGVGAHLFIVGTPSNLYTSPPAGFTAVTSQARATQTPGNVTDPAVPTGTWTGAGFIGAAGLSKRIRVTSGASTGAVAWPVLDTGAGSVRVSQWVIPTTPLVPPVNFIPAEVTVAPGDHFVVEDLTTIADLYVSPHQNDPSDHVTAFDSIVFANIRLLVAASQSQTVIATQGPTVLFLASDTGSPLIGPGNISFTACNMPAASLTNGAALWTVIACAVRTTILAQQAGFVTIDGDTLAQGVLGLRVRLGSSCRIGTLAVFSSPNQGVLLESDGQLRTGTLFYGADLLWGTGNTTRGLTVQSGGRFFYVTTPTITGGGDFSLGGSASVRPYDNTAGASAAAVATTWANLVAATPGGFGTHAIDPVTGAMVNKIT